MPTSSSPGWRRGVARRVARWAGETGPDLEPSPAGPPEPSPFGRELTEFEGDGPGTLLWEHYLCPPARLARRALHDEAVADWLGALGELWSATDALYQLVTTEDDALSAVL